MFQVTWPWASLFLIAVLALDSSVADDAASSGLQARIRAFKTDMPIPLDGDLSKWRETEKVTFTGKPLAGHPRHATSTLSGTRRIFIWHSMFIPRSSRLAYVNTMVTNSGKTMGWSS